MTLQVHHVEFYRIDMRTRFPFRYGIASLTWLPHLVVHAEVEIDGRTVNGVAADGLPPKWFTKNDQTTFEADDLPSMLRVIDRAAEVAKQIGPQANLFPWWWQLYQDQSTWAMAGGLPPLLAHFGTSLLERAVIDAFCRRHDVRFFDALVDNAFGIDLAAIRETLIGCEPRDCLPDRPRSHVILRHTIGLGDPITDEDILPEDKIDDGLPHSLVSNIQQYNLRYFKVKLSGDVGWDTLRLTRLAKVFQQHVGESMRLTLDGNEQFPDIESFRGCWEHYRAVREIREMMDHGLMLVEQPLHRDRALHADVARELEAWTTAPPIIIDESDGELSALPRALELGYSGTSHKNCKGVIKSVAARATIHRSDPRHARVLTGEDLANVGPIALLQDLAVVASLGIPHVERNGHHYFAGLSMFSDSVQDFVLGDHGDLYTRSERGFATLSVRDGQLNLASINNAPFGVQRLPDLSSFQAWDLRQSLASRDKQ